MAGPYITKETSYRLKFLERFAFAGLFLLTNITGRINPLWFSSLSKFPTWLSVLGFLLVIGLATLLFVALLLFFEKYFDIVNRNMFLTILMIDVSLLVVWLVTGSVLPFVRDVFGFDWSHEIQDDLLDNFILDM